MENSEDWSYAYFRDDVEEMLLRDDPRVRYLIVNGESPRENFTERFARAVRHSTHVEKLGINLENYASSFPALDSIPQCIIRHTHRALKSIGIRYGFAPNDELLVGQFIQAASQQPFITTFSMRKCRVLVTDFVRLVRSPHIKALSLSRLVFLPTATTTEVTNAFASNANLSKIEIIWGDIDTTFLLSILQGLQCHTGLRELWFRCYKRFVFTADQAELLARVLSSAPNLAKVHFLDFAWDVSNLRPIAAALRSRESPMKIWLEKCCFLKDTATCDLFQSIFEEPVGVERSLVIDRSAFHSMDIHRKIENLLFRIGALEDGSMVRRDRPRNSCFVSDLVRLSTNMTFLDVQCEPTPMSSINEDVMNSIVSSFTNILDAAALSTSLQTLRLGTLCTPRFCEALIAKLPSIRNVRSLAFSLDDSCAHLKTRLLIAFRENGSLIQWEIQASFLEDRDFAVLRLYVRRNANLPALLASKPGTSRLPIGALPSLFCRSFDTMHGTAGILQALVKLGDDIGSCAGYDEEDERAAKKQRKTD